MKKILATLATLRTLNVRQAKRLFAVLERKPYIEISQFGWKTDRPQVVVGMMSRRGMTTVMAKLDDDAGNAHCSMHAQTLSNITGFTVVDRRETAKNEATPHNGFRALPRDAQPTPVPVEVKPTGGTLGFRLLGGLRIA